jgi:glycine/D-amino acid oxidase-like deaminating enzyme
MDLRTHYPFSLLRFGIIRSYPSLDKDLKTDVAIIGAGITAALVARELRNKGMSCVVTDKRHVAMGSTSASTSLIQYEIDQPLHKLVDLVGYRQAVRSYEVSREAVAELGLISKEQDMGEEFKKKCSFQFASYKKHVSELGKEYIIRQKHGFAVEFLDAQTIREQFHFSAPAGLYTSEAAQLDAYLLTHKIFASLGEQCQVYDHTEVSSIQHLKDGVKLTTASGFAIQARYLVIACGYESGNYLDRRFDDLRCTYALVSEPMPQQDFWRDNCLIWETADPYMYGRITGDNRVMIGGKDTPYLPLNKQILLLPRKLRALLERFRQLFPHLPIKADFSWAGAFATTRDGLPYIDQLPGKPGTWLALGYGGNGITFSLVAAKIISSALQGKKSPDASLFSFNR